MRANESNVESITRRRKKRTRKAAFDKKLIRLHREEKRILKQIYQAEWIELKPPVQRGFVRYFAVRPDVLRSREGLFFDQLLKKINTRQYSSREDFKKKGRRFGKKVYNDREQRLKDLTPDEYKKTISEREQKYFDAVNIHVNKRISTIYRFSESWRYVLIVQPNMIRKVQVKQPVLEGRITELGQYLQYNNRRQRLQRLLGVSNYAFCKHEYREEKYKALVVSWAE